ncbi:MAG: tRNA lysidine(34) synthetase TilS, partial [Clostridiales bacterium]|nr:tRNA lysidine(34) synthetase TilS [Clostridiales bacterium]
MNEEILKTVEKYNMLSKCDRVLAAVSGGADSMAMLNFLLWAKDRYSLDVFVAHIEHGIRGQESLDDADFVENYCKKNSLEFHILHINAVEEARKASMGVEEYSREKRYEFFSSFDCDKIATAHNLSDNAETVLFRLFRGTGLKGMCGVPPVRGRIIRPLIEISADRIREYCREENIEYKVDSTNFDNKYSRNIVRNQIFPHAKSINPNVENAVNNFISNACEDYEFIENEVKEAYASSLCDGMLSLDILNGYNIAVIKRVISKYFTDNGFTIDRLHLLKITDSLASPFAKIQIKDNVYAVSDKRHLRIAEFNTQNNNVNLIKKILNIDEFNKNAVDFYCDCDKIIGSVTV